MLDRLSYTQVYLHAVSKVNSGNRLVCGLIESYVRSMKGGNIYLIWTQVQEVYLQSMADLLNLILFLNLIQIY